MLCGHRPSRCQSRQPPRGWIRRAVLGPWCTSLTVASHAPAVTLPRHTRPPGRQAPVFPRIWSPWRPRGSVLGLSFFVHTRVPGSPRLVPRAPKCTSSAQPPCGAPGSPPSSCPLHLHLVIPSASSAHRAPNRTSPSPLTAASVLRPFLFLLFSSYPSFTPTEIHNWLFLQNLSRT